MTTIAAGDLIYQFAVQDSTSSPIASWTQGLSPWTLLSADVLDSTAAQYQVQASVGTINPAFSMSPAYNWNTAAIAFKSAPAGTVPRTGIRVVRAQHLAFPAYRGSPTTINFPCKYEGAEVEIGFNPQFLVDALRVVDTDDVTLELTAPNRPGLLKAGRHVG